MNSEKAIRRLIKFEGNCCMSCHDEEELGVSDMIEIELGKDRIVYVCCAVNNAYKDYQIKRNKK